MIAQELEVSLHMAFVDARQQRHEFIKKLLDHHHHKFHGRVVVIEQNHLKHLRRLGFLWPSLKQYGAATVVVRLVAGWLRRLRAFWGFCRHEFHSSYSLPPVCDGGIQKTAGAWRSRFKRALKKPLRVDPERFSGGLETPLDYMWSIITCPNPEQLTCVAPSIRRAKS